MHKLHVTASAYLCNFEKPYNSRMSRIGKDIAKWCEKILRTDIEVSGKGWSYVYFDIRLIPHHLVNEFRRCLFSVEVHNKRCESYYLRYRNMSWCVGQCIGIHQPVETDETSP